MKKLWKIALVAILAGTGMYLWSTDLSIASSTEVLDGYNEEQAVERFEEVKEKMPEQVTPAVGLNPAHGQPGHRCDIPVGTSLDAPLKSTGNNGLLNTSAASAMLNPAHGQPGHRCDLAVGAPLPQ